MHEPRFIDLFSGCGGLSLGLANAGWKGILAIEKNADAFQTLKQNLIDRSPKKFDWFPSVAQSNHCIEELLEKQGDELSRLEGKVDLIAGGPPCQGFSMAGKRDPRDPRNKLVNQYLKFVKIVKPRFLCIENVAGFNSKFKNQHEDNVAPYSRFVIQQLREIGYQVDSSIIKATQFGVPQRRVRFIIIAEKTPTPWENSPFAELESAAHGFVTERNLTQFQTVEDAIGDFTTEGRNLEVSRDSVNGVFYDLPYKPPFDHKQSEFQKLMRANGAPDSLRLPRHSQKIKERFVKIINECEPGKSVSDAIRIEFGIKKQVIHLLDRKFPSATITTLPDDIVHYKEPRILTVRETARVQSFPDWFSFSGPYTTGGPRRKNACPRYTQVGNAVPPLLGEAIGEQLKRMWVRASQQNYAAGAQLLRSEK